MFTLTYGAFVAQLLKDYEDVQVVNQQLEKIGHNIGVRLINEFLAKSGVSNCSNFRETADTIAKVGLKMFLGVTADVTSWNSESSAFSLVLSENPFIEFVELPPHLTDLHYCNILCGVLKGALEAVEVQIECKIVKDALKGDDVTEFRVELKGMVRSAMSDEYKET